LRSWLVRRLSRLCADPRPRYALADHSFHVRSGRRSDAGGPGALRPHTSGWETRRGTLPDHPLILISRALSRSIGARSIALADEHSLRWDVDDPPVLARGPGEGARGAAGASVHPASPVFSEGSQAAPGWSESSVAPSEHLAWTPLVRRFPCPGVGRAPASPAESGSTRRARSPCPVPRLPPELGDRGGPFPASRLLGSPSVTTAATPLWCSVT
jgi:hypothetical protein